MKRIVLMVFVAGSIMWGLIEVCGCAVVYASPYFTTQKIEFFGECPRRVDNAAAFITPAGLLIEPSPKNYHLMASNGRLCIPHDDGGACPADPDSRIGTPCICPDGREGSVVSQSSIFEAPTMSHRDKDKKSETKELESAEKETIKKEGKKSETKKTEEKKKESLKKKSKKTGKKKKK